MCGVCGMTGSMCRVCRGGAARGRAACQVQAGRVAWGEVERRRMEWDVWAWRAFLGTAGRLGSRTCGFVWDRASGARTTVQSYRVREDEDVCGIVRVVWDRTYS